MILRRPYATAIDKDIRLMRASRDARGLFVLLRHALETVQTDAGFIAIALVVVAAEKVSAEQAALIDDEGINGAAEVDHLIDRLRAKFGDVAEWAEGVESYIPERAFVFRNEPLAATARHPAVVRPLSLLGPPRAIPVIVRPTQSVDGQPVAFTYENEVHRLVHVHGPERIAGQWWNLSNKTRDYFDVLDEAGNRFWMFRVMETNQWYLHGIFE
jgi:protein ImuB